MNFYLFASDSYLFTGFQTVLGSFHKVHRQRGEESAEGIAANSTAESF